jgi:hypothetical protein
MPIFHAVISSYKVICQSYYFQAKLCRVRMQVGGGLKVSGFVAFEQKEKELTGLVHSFLWLSKTFPASTLRYSSGGARVCSLKPFDLKDIPKGGLEVDILVVRMAIDSRIKANAATRKVPKRNPELILR